MTSNDDLARGSDEDLQKHNDAMFEAVYEEIRKTAHRWLRKEAAGHSFQPTDLVHEVYMRMRSEARIPDSRGQFLAHAAVAMRRTLIDRARRSRAQKRGGDRQRVPLSQVFADGRRSTIDLLDLEEAIKQLDEIGGCYSGILTLRFLIGCSVEETAQALGLSTAKVKKDWKFARTFLHVHLSEFEGDDE